MTRKEILESATAIVTQDREEQYGKAEDNFGLIAELWEPYIQARCVGPDVLVDIGPDDVGILMALLKIARIATGQPKADNFVDLAGYAACAGEIAMGSADCSKGENVCE
jgi:hypothetical protein